MANKMGTQRNDDCQGARAAQSHSQLLSVDRYARSLIPTWQDFVNKCWSLIIRHCILSWTLQMLSLETSMLASPTSNQFFTFWPHQSWLKIKRTLTWLSQSKPKSWHTSVIRTMTPASRSFWMLYPSWTPGSKPSTSPQTTFLPLTRLKTEMLESARCAYNQVSNNYVSMISQTHFIFIYL